MKSCQSKLTSEDFYLLFSLGEKKNMAISFSKTYLYILLLCVPFFSKRSTTIYVIQYKEVKVNKFCQFSPIAFCFIYKRIKLEFFFSFLLVIFFFSLFSSSPTVGLDLRVINCSFKFVYSVVKFPYFLVKGTVIASGDMGITTEMEEEFLALNQV